MISFVSIQKSKMALLCRGNNVIHYISFVRIKSPNSQQFNMDYDDDDGDDDEWVDRQLVRMGYRFLVRGCKGL